MMDSSVTAGVAIMRKRQQESKFRKDLEGSTRSQVSLAEPLSSDQMERIR
jgi:hypothetical protein